MVPANWYEWQQHLITIGTVATQISKEGSFHANGLVTYDHQRRQVQLSIATTVRLSKKRYSHARTSMVSLYHRFLRASREAAIPPNQLPIALAMDVLFEDIAVIEEKREEKRGARFS